jgi:hypothetical protein
LSALPKASSWKSTPKTEIEELPESIEPPWLTGVRALDLRPETSAQRFDLLALFQ